MGRLRDAPRASAVVAAGSSCPVVSTPVRMPSPGVLGLARSEVLRGLRFGGRLLDLPCLTPNEIREHHWSWPLVGGRLTHRP